MALILTGNTGFAKPSQNKFAKPFSIKSTNV